MIKINEFLYKTKLSKTPALNSFQNKFNQIFKYHDESGDQKENKPKRTVNQCMLIAYAGFRYYDKEYSDYTCVRQVNHLECSPPFLVDDVEFCVIRIRGRSFMMHQIRRMIGLLLAVTREVIDSNIFERAFSRSLINVPTDKQHFTEYDRIVGNDGLYDKLTWEECDEPLKQFRDRYIDSKICQTEIAEQCTLEWVETLLNYQYIPEEECDVLSQNNDDKRLIKVTYLPVKS